MQCQLQPIVWLIFFNKLFHFLYKIWMLQVIKSDSCGISAVFFHCCFMIKTQVLMAVSDFSGIFSRKHFLEVGFTFQWQVYFLRWGASFLSWGCPWGASVLMGEFSKKNCRGGGGTHHAPHCGKRCPLIQVAQGDSNYWLCQGLRNNQYSFWNGKQT